MNLRNIFKNCLSNRKGQSLVEAAFTLGITIIILLAILSFGIYIYDMSVFVYASNKALDKGVVLFLKNNYQLSDDQKNEIRDTAITASNIRVFTSEVNRSSVDVQTIDDVDKIELIVQITSTYTGVPVPNNVLPQFKYKCQYFQKKTGS